MSIQCSLQLKGHIIDSLILSKVMDKITKLGANCRVEKIQIGEKTTNTSYARLLIETDSKDIMQLAIEIAQKHGAIVSCQEDKDIS